MASEVLLREKKNLLIHGHAASVFAEWCRIMHSRAQRYWDKFAEIYLACPDPESPGGQRVGESKWKRLTHRERDRVLNDLKDRWGRCPLSAHNPDARFEAFDAAVPDQIGSMRFTGD